jgi:hypothetical protein
MVIVTVLRTALLCAGASAAVAATDRFAPNGKTSGPRARPNAFCTGAGAHSFVGGSDGNVAGAADSGVLSGAENSSCGLETGIGAGGSNVAFSTASGAFIAAGRSNGAQTGYSAFIGSGMSNSTKSDWDVILGGAGNQVTAQRGVVLGGLSNAVGEVEGFVGGGAHNSVGGGLIADAVAGGESNGIARGLGASFIGGGKQNTIGGATSGSTAVIFGGANNTVNRPSSNTDCSHGAGCQTIGAGEGNQANNFGATVLGGAGNVAGGSASFAAGTRAWAAHDGTFVWADAASGAPMLKTSVPNQFLARASGGFFLYTNPANTVGAELPAGSGSWASISDRALKDRFVPIDVRAVLAGLLALPIAEWSYRSENGVRHMGPMAQDFAAAFGVGEDARHIATLDEAGVALAALQALDAETAARPNVPACSGMGADSFVGGNDGNVAAGQNAGVLTGQKNAACDFGSGVGAGGANAIVATQGGGEYSFIGGGFASSSVNGPNLIESHFGGASDGFIGAGNGNVLENSESGIGGGEYNSVSASDSFLGGGLGNSLGSTITDAFLGAGNAGLVQGNYAALVSGAKGPAGNSAAGGDYSFVGGGAGVTAPGKLAVVGGGEDNSAVGLDGVTVGGFDDHAYADYSVVPGGRQDQAKGPFSFAAGADAVAATTGSFVWSDGTDQVASTVDNQFVAEAVGGYTLYTNAGDTVGATLLPGSGTWASLSDRSFKRDVVPIDRTRVLAALRRLPISAWSYRTQPGVRHLGPTAQDFYAAFGVGEDDRHIAMIDEDGVVLAAAQALAPRVTGMLRHAQETDARLADAERSERVTIARLRARLSALQSARRK